MFSASKIYMTLGIEDHFERNRCPFLFVGVRAALLKRIVETIVRRKPSIPLISLVVRILGWSSINIKKRVSSHQQFNAQCQTVWKASDREPESQSSQRKCFDPLLAFFLLRAERNKSIGKDTAFWWNRFKNSQENPKEEEVSEASV